MASTINGLKGKVEIDIDINAPPTKFYHMFKKTAHHVPHCAGNHIQGVDVHEGDWESHGSIKVWKYTVDGKEESFKEKVEYDDENNKVTLIGIEGDVFKVYKCFIPVYHAVPKGQGSVVKLSIEYEKIDSSVPPPNKYLDMMVGITKDIDSHFDKGAPLPTTRTVVW